MKRARQKSSKRNLIKQKHRNLPASHQLHTGFILARGFLFLKPVQATFGRSLSILTAGGEKSMEFFPVLLCDEGLGLLLGFILHAALFGSINGPGTIAVRSQLHHLLLGVCKHWSEMFTFACIQTINRNEFETSERRSPMATAPLTVACWISVTCWSHPCNRQLTTTSSDTKVTRTRWSPPSEKASPEKKVLSPAHHSTTTERLEDYCHLFFPNRFTLCVVIILFMWRYYDFFSIRRSHWFLFIWRYYFKFLRSYYLPLLQIKKKPR